MTRLSNLFKMLAIGLTSMYLLQITACTPAPLTNTGNGISVIPNFRGAGNIVQQIQQMIQQIIPGT